MQDEHTIIFFDIDGTLLSTGGAGQIAISDALRDEFGVDFPLNGVLTAGRTDRGITDEIFGKLGIENSDSSRERFRNSYLSRLSFHLATDLGYLLPAVESLLKCLSELESVTLSLITGNYEEAAWIKLRHFGLDHHFSFGSFGDHEADRNNVAREAIVKASSILGYDVPGHNTVVIGDTGADIQCARAIGARAVAVATGSYASHELAPHEPDILLDNFSNVAGVTRLLLALE